MKGKIAVLTSGWAVDYVMNVINGMHEVCKKNNLDLYVFSCYKFTDSSGTENTTGFAIYDLINYKDYDGIVITPHLFNDSSVAEREHKRILKSGVPAVSLSFPLDNLSFVNSDNLKIYHHMISHLIEEHGCKNLAFIGGPDGNPGSEGNLQAFKDVLEAHNMVVNPENLYLHGDWSYDFALTQAEKIFNKKTKPDAIVCNDDISATAAIKTANKYGYKVPEDIKVIGFENNSASEVLIPSITSVNLNARKLGQEAIKLLMTKPTQPVIKSIKATAKYRQSCGCVSEITRDQIAFNQSLVPLLEESQKFSSQLRHMEDVFIENISINPLSKELQNYFVRRHYFEGKDFAVLIKDEVIKDLSSTDDIIRESTTYGKKMHILVNIQDGNAERLGTIPTKDLIPLNMRSVAPEMYLFLPIFHKKFLHGYYVGRNNLVMLKDKNAYNWTRNFGVSIEKFRQVLNFQAMSEKLAVLSRTDALSGLMNRTGLESDAIDLFKTNNKNAKETQIIFIDINDMKLINDKYGHLHGDLAVKTVAESIRDSIPPEYLAIRYGGDEFVVIGTKKGKTDYAEAIANTLKAKSKAMSLPYNLTASFGSKNFAPNEKSSLLDAIDTVDEMMYQNKVAYHSKDKKRK